MSETGQEEAVQATVLVAVADGIATLTVDRPKALNALDPETLDALEAAVLFLFSSMGLRSVERKRQKSVTQPAAVSPRRRLGPGSSTGRCGPTSSTSAMSSGSTCPVTSTASTAAAQPSMH